MFLTRLGDRSKMVINGDVTQIDLPPHVKSGLIDAQRVLANVSDIESVTFTEDDVFAMIWWRPLSTLMKKIQKEKTGGGR